MNRFPTLFVSHGAPTFALQPGRAGAMLGEFARRLPRPVAVVVVSAHWMSAVPQVTSHAAPPTVHDFGGFAPELFELSYPAPGDPALARRIVAMLASLGAREDFRRGLDHGAWVPLMHLYPQADVPVLQVSLPQRAGPVECLELGRLLGPLAIDGVLVMGSGSITHNLGDVFAADRQDGRYAEEFMDWTAATLAAGDMDALLDYRRRAPHAARAHPTEEHFLPLFAAMGAAGQHWSPAWRLEGGTEYGVLGMDAYVFGRTDLSQSRP